MKVLCDVCDKAPASLFCCADDAALCDSCDALIHAANKLAGKHQRVPLLYPSSDQELPHCDICQEKTGYFFCLEDRALLCRNCDYSIHSANTLAAKHKRFLVSGIQISLQGLTTDGTQISGGSMQSSPVTTEPIQSTSPIVRVSTPGQSNLVSVPSMKASDPHHCSSSHAKRAAITDAEEPDFSATTAQQPRHVQKQSKMDLLHSNSFSSSPSRSTSTFVNQQLYFSSGTSQPHWSTPTMTDLHSHAIFSAGTTSGSQRGAGGFVRRSSASDYLTETIPGWKVDELFGFHDMATMNGTAELGSSKAETSSSGDMDWHIGYNAFEDSSVEETAAEVPSVPSPPTTSGLPKSVKTWGAGRSLKQLDLDYGQGFDMPLVVPDIGDVFSPPDASSKSPENG